MLLVPVTIFGPSIVTVQVLVPEQSPVKVVVVVVRRVASNLTTIPTGKEYVRETELGKFPPALEATPGGELEIRNGSVIVQVS